MSTGLGDAGSLVPDYITYCGNTNLHPRTWGANGVGVYQWWLQRSNVQMQVSYATNGSQYVFDLPDFRFPPALTQPWKFCCRLRLDRARCR